MNIRYSTVFGGLLALMVVLLAASVAAVPCEAPDRGDGTVDLPANCPYAPQSETMDIIDGFPPGTEINCTVSLQSFSSIYIGPGGTLGGEIQWFDAQLLMEMAGTGALGGALAAFGCRLQWRCTAGRAIPVIRFRHFPTHVLDKFIWEISVYASKTETAACL
jgi:hypothetical protein